MALSRAEAMRGYGRHHLGEGLKQIKLRPCVQNGGPPPSNDLRPAVERQAGRGRIRYGSELSQKYSQRLSEGKAREGLPGATSPAAGLPY
jgi:hypothetical protein